MITKLARSSERLVVETVQWARLPFIDDVAPISDEDYEVLRQLREVILRYGYEGRFGICLLHKHFDVQDGEMALEESDEQARVSTIKIVGSEVCQGAMETAWRFAQNNEVKPGLVCETKCKGFGMTGHTNYHTGQKK